MKRHLALKFLILGFVCLSGGFAGGLLIGENNQNLEPVPDGEIRDSADHTGYKFVNPLLDCDLGPKFISQGSIYPFPDALNKTIDGEHNAGHISKASVYFRDLDNGAHFSINEGLTFKPASLLKVPLAMLIMHEADKNPALLQQQVTYTGEGEDFSQHFPPEQAPIKGATYTISQLMDYMVLYSDNGATMALFKVVQSEYFDEIFKMLGIPVTQDDVNGNFISVKQYSTFLRILFNASYDSADSSEQILKAMSQTTFTQGLRAGVPNNVVVSHKFGEAVDPDTKEDELHDCGIIYYPNKPYLLCVSVRGNDYDDMAATIAAISQTTYQEVDSFVKQSVKK